MKFSTNRACLIMDMLNRAIHNTKDKKVLFQANKESPETLAEMDAYIEDLERAKEELFAIQREEKDSTLEKFKKAIIYATKLHKESWSIDIGISGGYNIGLVEASAIAAKKFEIEEMKDPIRWALLPDARMACRWATTGKI